MNEDIKKYKTSYMTLTRLNCGCLISCESGGILVEHEVCLNKTVGDTNRCQVDVYLKEHKRCLICGECLICYKHPKCKGIIRKIGHWIWKLYVDTAFYLSNIIYNLHKKGQ